MHISETPQGLSAADTLRTGATVHDPDPRTAMFGFPKPPSLVEHQAEIAAIELLPDVPEKVAVAFETARNLYLYAWHVFRFYPVAQMQAMAALEMGLRMRLPERLPEPYQRQRQMQPMLAGMLGYAIDQGLLQNSGFRRWHAAAARKAWQRMHSEAIQRMVEEQLESMTIDDGEAPEPTPQDSDWDLLSVLRQSLPHARNELAHGSPMLTRQVWGSIELVAEILNQLFHSDPLTTTPSQPCRSV